jgi:hypothetical protein
MLFIDRPASEDIAALSLAHGDACVSIYEPTTPLTQHIGAARIWPAPMIRAHV